MRYLNKVCFINSATVKYAELNLNGNVHFIGTQGVGKSTLLRAILFFYNANSLKLGVPSGPTNKSFAEWYFPYQNSYIVYEVQRETGAYCILVFKAQNRPCYNFIDAPFDRNMFIGEDRKAFATWEKIRTGLDSNKIFYSRRIKSYEEYRDILYGNDQGKKEFGRYALLESRQYLNIPRTIQNVFLNSKLDAEFIKQTIIDSMNEETLEIDLQSYTHHLKDFETQLDDISQFRQSSVQKQADKVSKLYVAIKHLQMELRQHARNLKGSLDAAIEKEPHLTEALQADEMKKNGVLERDRKEAASHQRRLDKISAEISVLNDKLKMAKIKEEEYNRLNIQELLKRVDGRNSLEQGKKNLLAEKNLLAGQFQEITQKYAALQGELDNQEQSFANLKENEKLVVKEDFFVLRDGISQQYGQLLEEVRRQHQAEVIGARQHYEEQTRLIYQLKNKRAACKHRPLYDTEINQNREDLKALENALQQAKNQKVTNGSRLETLKREQQLEETSLQDAHQRKIEQIQQRLQNRQEQIQQITLKLESSKDALYGWLNQHHSGWESTIGKVCDEAVLFDDSLFPRKTTGSVESFYGVQLDLSERAQKAKSLDDYQHERALLLRAVESDQNEIKSLTQDLEDDLQKLKQRLQPKVRALKESNRELDYEIGQNPQKQKTVQLLLNQFVQRAQQEKQAELEVLDSSLADLAEQELQARDALDKLEAQLSRRLNGKERERKQKILEQEQSRDQQLEIIEGQILANRLEYQQRKEEVQLLKSCELDHKGVDTTRLNRIDQQLTRIDVELEFIEKNRDLVAGYRKDKRELFDRLKEFKNQQQLLQRKLEQKRQDFEQQQSVRQQELADLQLRISQRQLALEHIKQDLEKFEHFKLSEVFQWIENDLLSDLEPVDQDKGCRVIIDGIKENYYALLRRQNDLKEAVDKFLGHFSSDNLFKFETHLSSLKSYLHFSQELTEFIEEDKISEFEKRINERFADIVTGLGKETTGLMTRTGDIQKVISKINRDFTEKNFVGAIRKIELKLDESANSVFVVLRQIKEFNDQHASDFGTRDLFSTRDHELNNKKAVDLLKQLMKEISDSKSISIALPDSFELKFRVEENQNDTGWVEKLSNVGSDGTDILVKAMVNIMLLNVFKEGASRRFRDFRLHCMMDEIGKLHPSNVHGILKFANDRNILLINGSPTESNALNYRHIFKVSKDSQSITRVTRILTNTTPL